MFIHILSRKRVETQRSFFDIDKYSWEFYSHPSWIKFSHVIPVPVKSVLGKVHLIGWFLLPSKLRFGIFILRLEWFWSNAFSRLERSCNLQDSWITDWVVRTVWDETPREKLSKYGLILVYLLVSSVPKPTFSEASLPAVFWSQYCHHNGNFDFSVIFYMVFLWNWYS